MTTGATPRTLGAACGAAWGVGAAGLVAAHFRVPAPAPLLTLGAALGATAGLLRPRAEALRHPWAALLAAAAGLFMGWVPEPTCFLLAPLLAAAAAWPLRGDQQPAPGPGQIPRWGVLGSFLAAGSLFFVQSANRYWGFGAGSKDLGLFYQTHWLIAHGLPPQNTVMGMHALADHMELLDYLVAPLLRLHDSAATLLLVQSLAVASGVFPLCWMGARLLDSPRAGLVLAWAWLLAPDLHMGVMFDYNPTLLGSAGLLWTAWALLCRGLPSALLAGLVTCLAKENLCLYLAVLALVLALRGASRRNALALAALALALFSLEMAVAFPRFRQEGFRHWEFEDLGETPAETAVTAATRPQQALSLLVDHPHKRRSLLQPLASFGFAGLADPVSLALQLPNWGERLLSSHRTRWWGYHYGVPGAATAVVGLLLGWLRLRASGREGPLFSRYVLGSVLLLGLLPPYRTPLGNRRSDLYYLRQSYTVTAEDAASQRAAVAFVGRDPYLKVAAQDRLLPYLAGRRQIYMLDRALEADVIVLQTNGATWPDGRPRWRRRLREIWDTGAFTVAFCQGRSVVLKRGTPPGLDCPAFEEARARTAAP